jgi:hypothetical protein
MSLGIGTDRNDGEEVEIPYPSKILNKHIAILGSTGSGKTVAAKVIIEEAAMNGIPSVIIDPQGDLSQLAMFAKEEDIESADGDLDRFELFKEKVEVRIWTPARSKGLPICIDPFSSPPVDMDDEERIGSLDMMAAGFAAIAGYNVEKPDGSQIKAYLNKILEFADKGNKFPGNFTQLANFVGSPHGLQKKSGISEQNFVNSVVGLLSKNEREKLTLRLLAQETGVKKLMFTMGIPVDFDVMIQPCEDGKIPINILYLNTLTTDEMKQSFLQEFARRLYDWLPSKGKTESDTRLLFFIDEVAPYIPPHPRNPPSKNMMRFLLSQGRKYGLSCMIATQNFADVDYKILGQANTRLYGKVLTKQEQDKVRDLLKSTPNSTTLIDKMPSLDPGEFLLICNDAYGDTPVPVNFRWLYTEHSKPLDEDDIEELTSDELRAWAKQFETRKRKSRKGKKEPSSTSVDEVVAALEEANREATIAFGDVQSTDDEQFEMDLLGGFLLLKDSRDPISVMLGLTNTLTTIVLLWSSCLLALAWLDSEIQGIATMFAILVSLITASILIAEMISGDEVAILRKIRMQARPLQYLALLWVWVLWFLVLSDKIQLDEILLPIEIAQTAMTMFVILELAHRVKIGTLEWPSGNNPLEFLKGGIKSLKMMVGSTQIEVLRASSRELLESFRLVMDIVIAFTLVGLIYETESFSFLSSTEWLTRLLTIYILTILSQIRVRQISN